MKLLKYVMTSDSGLAPNPYHGICSLALCTPNHMRARLDVGDWIVGHSSSVTGRKLIHAMRITRILTMPEYFEGFPQKRPNPGGTRAEQCGDNLYYLEGSRWRRLPSSGHNHIGLFRQDQGSPVFLAEGAENYWYFGGLDDPFAFEFSNRFPGLIKDRQGFSYVRDIRVIYDFVAWLSDFGKSGMIGSPRDEPDARPDQFLLGIDPEPEWIRIGPAQRSGYVGSGNSSCTQRVKYVEPQQSCGQPKGGCK